MRYWRPKTTCHLAMDETASIPSIGSPEIDKGNKCKDRKSGKTTLSDDTWIWPATLVSSTMTFVTPKRSAWDTPIIESTFATDEFETDHR